MKHLMHKILRYKIIFSALLITSGCELFRGGPSEEDIRQAMNKPGAPLSGILALSPTKSLDKIDIIEVIRIGDKQEFGWPVELWINATCAFGYPAGKKEKAPCQATGFAAIYKDSFGEWRARQLLKF